MALSKYVQYTGTMAQGRSRTITTNGESNTQQWKEWVLLHGHRSIIIGLTALLFFAIFTGISISEITPLQNYQPLFYVFSGLITGNLTVITVVVSINQLLLSRELNSPGELRSQMESVINYRSDIEDAAGELAPVEPQGFLRFLFENTRREAQQLGGLTISETDEEVYNEIDQVISKMTTQIDRVDTLLQESSASSFDVLSVTLTTNYAKEIHHLRRINSQYRERLTVRTGESIDNLISYLHDVDIARQYFKSIFLQEELASLSRLLFYTGLPSLAVVMVGLLIFTAGNGISIPRLFFPIVLPAIITIGLLPIIVLFAYILRIATVTRRTAATLPFTTPSQEK